MAQRLGYALFPVFLLVGGVLLPQTARAAAPAGRFRPDIRPPASALRLPAAQVPLVFEPNRGQVGRAIRFVAHGPSFTLEATRAGATVRYFAHRFSTPSALQLLPAGLSGRARLVGIDPLPGRVNYFLGDNPSQWRTNIPTFGGIEYRNVYPGINLRFHERAGQLEYDWVLRAGASPAKIALNVRGVSRLALNARGDLQMRTGHHTIVQQRPTIYQMIGERRHAVSGGFSLRSGGQVGIRVGRYDRSRQLIVDPTLVYSTYLPGSGNDVTTDGTGNAYVAGGYTPGPYGSTDVFVSKINTNASGAASLVYTSYLGGSSNDDARGIAIDGGGNVYVTGSIFSNQSTTTPFPVKNAFQPTFGGGQTDAFLSKLSAAGNTLLYSTFFGGSNGDWAGSIALDSTGHAYIEGTTHSSTSEGFVVKNAFQPNYGSEYNGYNGFVAGFDTTASGPASLLYSTYLGPSENGGGINIDTEAGAGGIALDSSGDIYVTGITRSSTFPVRNGFQTAYGGGFQSGDAFVAKLDPHVAGAAALLYSSYLGGQGDESATDIAVDSRGRAYIIGGTTSVSSHPPGFPTKNAYQNDDHGGSFLTVVDTTASGAASLLYSTCLGGTNQDLGFSVATNGAGVAYLTGITSSSDFPLVNPIQSTLNGTNDLFIATLNTNLAGTAGLTFSTYLGGSGEDGGNNDAGGTGSALDSGGNLYITGPTESTGQYPSGYPTKNGFQTGSGSGFLTRIAVTATAVSLTVSPTSGPATTTVRLTGTGFTPGETISVYWNCATYPCAGGVSEGTTTASSSGTSSKVMSVPISATVGIYTIAVHGQSSGITATTRFAVTAIASSWAAGTPNPAPTSYLAGALLRDGRIIALGGYGSSGTPTTNATALSPFGTSWTVLAPMHVPRASFAAATGSDGKTYAFGGYTGGAITSPVTPSIEAYDPSGNAWSSAGALRTARYEEAAVAGRNGIIYVLGGIDAYGTTVSSVEAYTPGQSFPTYVSPMPTARSGFAAAVGRDGRIYAIGGLDAGGIDLRTVEAYNPSTDTWVTLASMPTGCHHCTAAPGPDGRIYVTGGNAGRLVQVFNPLSNSWTTAPSTLTTHNGGITVATANDRVYAIGGDGTESSNEYLVITPVRVVSAWRAVPDLAQPLNFLASTTGQDGRVYALGGYGAGGAPTAQAQAYTPGASGWTSLPAMQLPRASLAAATGVDGRIYAIGGDTGTTITATVEAYSPASRTWSYTGSLRTARYATAAAYGRTTGNLYVFGGRDANDGTLSSVEMYNATLGTWSYVAPMPTPRSGMAAVAGMDGRIYVIGGRDAAGNVLGTVEVYDPVGDSWTTAAPMPTPRRYLGAAIDNFGRIYAIDGLSGTTSSTAAPGSGQPEMPIGGSSRISRSDPLLASSTPLGGVEVFYPASNIWAAGPPTIYTRYGLGAATGSDGRIYAIGGDTNTGQRAEAYNPS